MNKPYEKPELDIIRLTVADVITTSGSESGSESGGTPGTGAGGLPIT